MEPLLSKRMVNRRIRRFPETVLHEDSGIPDRQLVAQRRGKTPSYSRWRAAISAPAESLKPETESGSLTFNPADLFGRKLRKTLLPCDGYPQLFLPVFRSVQLNRSARASPNPLGSSSEDNAPTAFAKESREAFEEATDSS